MNPGDPHAFPWEEKHKPLSVCSEHFTEASVLQTEWTPRLASFCSLNFGHGINNRDEFTLQALAWSPWASALAYPLQDGGSKFLSQLFLVVPQVAGLILFVLWKEENGGDMGSLSQWSCQQ